MIRPLEKLPVINDIVYAEVAAIGSALLSLIHRSCPLLSETINLAIVVESWSLIPRAQCLVMCLPGSENHADLSIVIDASGSYIVHDYEHETDYITRERTLLLS